MTLIAAHHAPPANPCHKYCWQSCTRRYDLPTDMTARMHIKMGNFLLWVITLIRQAMNIWVGHDISPCSKDKLSILGRDVDKKRTVMIGAGRRIRVNAEPDSYDLDTHLLVTLFTRSFSFLSLLVRLDLLVGKNVVADGIPASPLNNISKE